MLHIIWVWSYRNIYIIKSKCREPSLDNKSFSSINDWKRSWSHLFYRIICWLLRCPKTCRILRFQSCCCPFCWRKFWNITIKKLVNIPQEILFFEIFRNSTCVIFMILFQRMAILKLSFESNPLILDVICTGTYHFHCEPLKYF